ncbi:unnamed protein product [Acanthosepion pharaonis]|uniref:Uncharacterized protein n=1 Tax=Acanthosepion pharaonis TaxID=158019 RepID=A0A812BM98_ACAPH|nr:unnamed protein product [Sepia pharaonis]
MKDRSLVADITSGFIFPFFFSYTYIMPREKSTKSTKPKRECRYLVYFLGHMQMEKLRWDRLRQLSCSHSPIEMEPHGPETTSTDLPQMSSMEEQDNPSFTEDEVFGNDHSPRPAANTNGIRPDVMIEVSNSSPAMDPYRNQSSSTLADIDVDTPGNSIFIITCSTTIVGL